MYVTKLKKEGGVKVEGITFKILSTGEQSACIAIFADDNKIPIIHKINFTGELIKNVANL